MLEFEANFAYRNGNWRVNHHTIQLYEATIEPCQETTQEEAPQYNGFP